MISIIEISIMILYVLFFFFFSSRRRHTRLQGDWSSDVCSSDLVTEPPTDDDAEKRGAGNKISHSLHWQIGISAFRQPEEKDKAGDKCQDISQAVRSEERRVGKECRSRW